MRDGEPMKTDAEKCRLIAEFEMGRAIPDNAILDTSRGTPHAYPHDLNATMRAARRLPSNVRMQVDQTGGALIYTTGEEGGEQIGADVPGDPARAAFLALSGYLERKP